MHRLSLFTSIKFEFSFPFFCEIRALRLLNITQPLQWIYYLEYELRLKLKKYVNATNQIGCEVDELPGAIVDQPWRRPTVADTLDVGGHVDWSAASLSWSRSRHRTWRHSVDDLFALSL